ncbi:MAG: FtsX-like permease family protein [Acidobacteria bacterium]|nr:FtsX-like permease family protein [Acidobacteriota bacterium]
MNKATLVHRSLGYYRRSHLAVICGVAAAVAVLAGALLVGDSVRGSLRSLALNRIGETDDVITANGFFRQQLAADLKAQEGIGAEFRDVCAFIALEGAVTNDANRRRAGGVAVYGVDESFFAFHNRPTDLLPAGNEVLISPGLAAEIGANTEDQILLRIEKPSAIPVESIHARKEDLGITMRSLVKATLAPENLGEFSLRPQQGAVRAVFISLSRLQRNLEQENKTNILLLSRRDRTTSDAQAASIIRNALKETFQLADLGLKLRALPAGCIALESDTAIIPEELANRAASFAEELRLRPSPVMTYLANSIRIGGRVIPYSLVTSLTPFDYQRIKGGAGEKASVNMPLVLNDWAASDLGAKPGDEVELEYYLWREEGRLDTARSTFRLDATVPLRGAAEDRDYSPEYPGITGAENLSDWDPPFPVDLTRIRPRDEDYWDKYRTTPKAFILLEDGQRLWQTRYGRLTSVRFYPNDPEDKNADLAVLKDAYSSKLRAALDPTTNGLTVASVRSENLAASRGGTDFGQYFTYFSFFLVVSALLLAALFFRLNVEQRLREIGLLRAVGFPPAEVRNLYLREGVLLAVAGSAIGAFGAIAYAWLMMYGLRTFWVGAVGTTALELHVSIVSLLIGATGGIITAALCIVLTLRGLLPASPRSLLTGSLENVSRSTARGTIRKFFSAKRLALVCGAAGLALLFAGMLKVIGQAGGFFGAGSLLLVAGLCLWSIWLQRENRPLLSGQGAWTLIRLGFRNATFRPGRSVLCIALVAAATFILVAVDAFRRDTQLASLDPKSGTGGYSLIAESLLPIVHDPNGSEGRENLNLSGYEETLEGVTLTRFRLRPGDDASCLNLYQPRNPRILGASEAFTRSGRFAFQGSLAENDAERENPWLLLDREFEDGAIPVIADANSLAYVLHIGLGDELTVGDDAGEALRMKVVGALSDSIFQGELIMSERNFVRRFPAQEGFRLFLVDAPAQKTDEVSALLEDRLSDYGFDAASTAEKLAGFHQVENTYLSTFQTLGGLGLLLGTFGLAAVLVRNVIERRRELALLRAVGYPAPTFTIMVVAENALLLLCGLLTGYACAVLAIAPALATRGGFPPARSILLLAAVLVTGMLASLIAVRAARRAGLLSALRSE